MSWAGIGSAVANVAGSGSVKDNDTSGSIKSAFGSLLLNLGASAGSIGISALAKRVGGTQLQSQFGLVGQSAAARALTAGQTELQRQREIVTPNYLPALVIGVIGAAGIIALVMVAARRKRA